MLGDDLGFAADGIGERLLPDLIVAVCGREASGVCVQTMVGITSPMVSGGSFGSRQDRLGRRASPASSVRTQCETRARSCELDLVCLPVAD